MSASFQRDCATVTAPKPSAHTKQRLLVITGKGGVGKTTVAAALGVAASRRGLRTIVAEVGARTDVPGLLSASATGSPRGRSAEIELARGLYHVSVEPRRALEEYLRNEVAGRLAGAILARSRAFDALAMAAPGLRELLTVGSVWELAQRPRRSPRGQTYDLVILDAPASGHALGLLGAPRTFGAIAGVGPIARQAGAIDRTLRNPRATTVIAIASPEQMAVSEALELRASLRERLGISLGGVIVNGLFPARFSAAEERALAAAADAPAVRSARWYAARARAQREQLSRLRGGLADVPHTTLPFLFAVDLRRREIERLGEWIERWLP